MAFSEESNDVVALLDEEDTQALQHLETRISDWLHRVTKGGRGLPPGQDAAFEVEAKFGTLIDRDTNERLRTHPANFDSKVPSTRFRAEVSADQFRHFNRFLIDLDTSTSPHVPDAIQRHETIDEFYRLGGDDQQQDCVRVSKDALTHRVRPNACLIKKRLGNFDISCPHEKLDFRVSASIEIQTDMPSKHQKPTSRRKKLRLSYTQAGSTTRFDLSKVQTSLGRGWHSIPLLQLEVESIALSLASAYAPSVTPHGQCGSSVAAELCSSDSRSPGYRSDVSDLMRDIHQLLGSMRKG